MAKEFLVLVDKNDNPIGKEEKVKCHLPNGLLHRAFTALIFDKEGRLIRLEFEEYYLINTYVPNSGTDRLEYRVTEWDVKLREYIKKLDKPLILVGDMNCAFNEIDLARPDTNHNTAGFTDEERNSFSMYFTDCDLVDTYRHLHPKKVKYTYWSYMRQCRAKNIGWRIDYALVSSKLIGRVKRSNILSKQIGSDHCPIYLRIK